jgi:ABC-type transport system involved in cytochrome c biogenesis permease subunit
LLNYSMEIDMNMISIFKYILFFLYSFALFLYMYYFIKQKISTKVYLFYVILFTILFHFIYLIFLTIKVNRLPLSNVFEVMTSLVFIFVLLYFIIERHTTDHSLGVIILLIAWPLQLISNCFLDVHQSPASILKDFNFYEVHVISTLLSYSAFTLAFISSLMYILLSREIHKKQLGFFFSRLPSLELLDRMSNFAIIIGTFFITFGIILGISMASKVWGAVWAKDPKLISVFITWIIYFAFIFLRNAKGWQGTRASVLSIIGYIWILISFSIIGLFLSNLHSFI